MDALINKLMVDDLYVLLLAYIIKWIKLMNYHHLSPIHVLFTDVALKGWES